MGQPQAILHYGNFASPLITAEGYTRRRDGLHSGRFTVVNDSADSYPENSIFQGFTILEDDVQRIGDVWEHNLNCAGIKGGKANRRIKRAVSYSLEGFDTASETWLTTNQNQILPGNRLQGYTHMVCESSQPEELEVTGWYRIQASYRGIARTKPVKRTISANVDVSVVDNLVLIAPGGDSGTAHKWAISWPKVTVTFSYVSTTADLKPMPQQGGTPAGTLPTIQPALTGLLPSDSITYNWPNGWRLVSMPIDVIAGTNVSLVQEVWEWQQRVTV